MSVRADTRELIMDTLMDFEAAQTPRHRGATAKQIAKAAGISRWRVYAEVLVLINRDLIDICGYTGATKPTAVYRMKRTRKKSS